MSSECSISDSTASPASGPLYAPHCRRRWGVLHPLEDGTRAASRSGQIDCQANMKSIPKNAAPTPVAIQAVDCEDEAPAIPSLDGGAEVVTTTKGGIRSSIAV